MAFSKSWFFAKIGLLGDNKEWIQSPAVGEVASPTYTIRPCQHYTVVERTIISMTYPTSCGPSERMPLIIYAFSSSSHNFTLDLQTYFDRQACLKFWTVQKENKIIVPNFPSSITHCHCVKSVWVWSPKLKSESKLIIFMITLLFKRGYFLFIMLFIITFLFLGIIKANLWDAFTVDWPSFQISAISGFVVIE